MEAIGRIFKVRHLNIRWVVENLTRGYNMQKISIIKINGLNNVFEFCELTWRGDGPTNIGPTF